MINVIVFCFQLCWNLCLDKKLNCKELPESTMISLWYSAMKVRGRTFLDKKMNRLHHATV